ncbi:MAG: ABC transporter ATP-binding protein [Cyclobacteriaceae bacterium]|nr:ABC transporter ATP-binding protein [Cyclobacteriaceae bacterium]
MKKYICLGYWLVQTVRDFIKKHFSGFTFFYRILQQRIFFALCVGVVVGMLDGFGLAMFFPMLQLVGGETEATGEGMGNLDFLVDTMQHWGLVLNLRSILVVLIIFFLLKGIIFYFGNYYQVQIRQYFLRKMRLSLLQDFNRIKFKKFISWDIGRIQNAFTTETERITNAFTHYFRSMDMSVHVLVYMTFAFIVDAGFSLLVIAGGILSNFLYRYFYKLSKHASRNLSLGNSRFHGLVLQYITNFKYLKATGRNDQYVDKLEKTVLEIEEENTRLGKYGAILQSAREPIMIIVVATVIVVQTEALKAPLGPILVSLLFFYRALTALNNLQTSWNNYILFSGSLENVVGFSADLRMSKEKQKGEVAFTELNSNLRLECINFAYGKQSILKDIDLEIKKYESIALVGESGSGKTTLVNILSGLLKPDEGIYSIDNKDIRQLSTASFQERVGFITQEPVIFNADIFDNITFWEGRSKESTERFWQAVKQAALFDFIQSLPEKEDTMLGNGGINLSGGQRQRIAIARELYRDIDILILDEATSALDTETERYIQESLDTLKGKYTMISVAHRLSTVRNADRIVMMANGRIEHIAPFDKLITQSERFKKMVELQEI